MKLTPQFCSDRNKKTSERVDPQACRSPSGLLAFILLILSSKYYDSHHFSFQTLRRPRSAHELIIISLKLRKPDVLARVLDGEFAHAESSKSPSKAEDPATEPESGEQSQAVVQAMAAMMRGLTSTKQSMLLALFRQQNTTPDILTEAENPQIKRQQPLSGRHQSQEKTVRRGKGSSRDKETAGHNKS